MDNNKQFIVYDSIGRRLSHQYRQVSCYYCGTLLNRVFQAAKITCVNCKQIIITLRNNPKKSRILAKNPQLTAKIAKSIGVIYNIAGTASFNKSI